MQVYKNLAMQNQYRKTEEVVWQGVLRGLHCADVEGWMNDEVTLMQPLALAKEQPEWSSPLLANICVACWCR